MLLLTASFIVILNGIASAIDAQLMIPLMDYVAEDNDTEISVKRSQIVAVLPVNQSIASDACLLARTQDGRQGFIPRDIMKSL